MEEEQQWSAKERKEVEIEKKGEDPILLSEELPSFINEEQDVVVETLFKNEDLLQST